MVKYVLKLAIKIAFCYIFLLLIYPVLTGQYSKIYASSTVRFLYDGDGVRVAKIEEGKTTLYVGDLEKNITTGETTRYYSIAGKRVAVKDNSGTNYIVSEHLGSLTALTDSSGNPKSDIKYYPYGTVRVKTGMFIASRQYTSQINDDSTGLYFYNARYYNPQIGNFIQADKIGPALNKYAYVSGNPINFYDPSGNEEEDAGAGGTDITSPMQIVESCLYGITCEEKIFSWLDQHPDYNPSRDSYITEGKTSWAEFGGDALGYMQWKVSTWSLRKWAKGESKDFDSESIVGMSVQYGALPLGFAMTGSSNSNIRLYHGTTERFTSSINKKGIRASTGLNPTFAEDFETARAFSGDNGRVAGLQVRSPEAGYVYEVSVPRNLVQKTCNGTYCATVLAPKFPGLSDSSMRVIRPQYITAVYRVDWPSKTITHVAYRQNNFQWIPYR